MTKISLEQRGIADEKSITSRCILFTWNEIFSGAHLQYNDFLIILQDLVAKLKGRLEKLDEAIQKQTEVLDRLKEEKRHIEDLKSSWENLVETVEKRNGKVEGLRVFHFGEAIRILSLSFVPDICRIFESSQQFKCAQYYCSLKCST